MFIDMSVLLQRFGGPGHLQGAKHRLLKALARRHRHPRRPCGPPAAIPRPHKRPENLTVPLILRTHLHREENLGLVEHCYFTPI